MKQNWVRAYHIYKNLYVYDYVHAVAFILRLLASIEYFEHNYEFMFSDYVLKF